MELLLKLWKHRSPPLEVKMLTLTIYFNSVCLGALYYPLLYLWKLSQIFTEPGFEICAGESL